MKVKEQILISNLSSLDAYGKSYQGPSTASNGLHWNVSRLQLSAKESPKYITHYSL